MGRQRFIRSISVLGGLGLIALCFCASLQHFMSTEAPRPSEVPPAYDHMRDWSRFYNLVVSHDIKLPQEAVIISAVEIRSTNAEQKWGRYEVTFKLPPTHSPQQWLQAMAPHLPASHKDKCAFIYRDQHTVTYGRPAGGQWLTVGYIQYDEPQYLITCEWPGDHESLLAPP